MIPTPEHLPQGPLFAGTYPSARFESYDTRSLPAYGSGNDSNAFAKPFGQAIAYWDVDLSRLDPIASGDLIAWAWEACEFRGEERVCKGFACLSSGILEAVREDRRHPELIP